MSKLKNRLTNTLAHLPLDAGVNPIFATFLAIFGTLQLTAVVTHSNAYIHIITAWTDPNNSVSSTFSVILGTTVSLLYTFALLFRFALSQSEQKLEQPTKLLRAVGVILAYLRTVWESVILGPLIIGCLKTWKATDSNPVIVGLAIVGCLLFFLVAYPISLYCYCDSTVFSSNGDRKLTALNPQLFFHIYKLNFVIFTVLSQTAMVAIDPIFFVVYCLLIVKRPYFTYAGQQFKRGLLSVIAFVCVSRAFNAIVGKNQGSLFVEILGIGCFIALVELVSQYRLKKVLETDQFTVYKAKLLIFMTGDLRTYLQYLQKFIFQHHQQCSNPICKCQQVIDHLRSPQSDLYSERPWYEFIVNYIQGKFDLKDLDSMSKAEQKVLINKYKQLVFDVAEIYLFKLSQNNAAFLTISVYRTYLKAQNFFDQMWDTRRHRIFFYYFQDAISTRGKVQQPVNPTPQNYVNFQVEYTNYLKSMSRVNSKVSSFWREMMKRQPQQQKILQSLKQIQFQDSAIRQNYTRIKSNYKQTNELMDAMTKDYLDLVFNVSQNDPGYFIQPAKEEQITAKQRKNKGLDTARLYSYQSQTPTCLVSVDPMTFGNIQFTNSFFDDIMELQCGKVTNIDELILPELKAWHRQKVQKMVNEDKLSHMHNASFILNSKRKIVYTELMVQIVPSVSQGLRYAVFLNQILPQKTMFLTYKTNFQILYDSESFEMLVDSKLGYQNLKDAFSDSILEQISSKKVVDVELHNQMYRVSLLTQIEANRDVLLLQLKAFDLKATKINIEYEQTKDSKLMFKSSRFKPVAPKIYLNTNAISQNIKTIPQAEQTLKQKLENKKINKLFGLFTEKPQYKFIEYIKAVSIVTAIVMIVLLFSQVLIKVKAKQAYIDAWNNNEQYQLLNSAVDQTTMNMELVNLYHGTSMSQVAYNYLQSAPNISQKMIDFGSYYDREDMISQWPTFTFMNNKTITPGMELNTLVIDSYLQKPLTNLTSYVYADYSFGITYASLSSPLTQIQQQFNTFVINSLYSVLPNLSILKQHLSERVTRYLLNQSNWTLAFNTVLFVIISIAYFFTYVYSIRMMQLRNLVYEMLESVPVEVMEEKVGNCEIFSRKYNAEGIIDQDKPNRVPMMETNSLIMSRNASRMEAADVRNQNSSRMEEGVTEVSIIRGFGGSALKYQEKVANISEVKKQEKKYPKEQIFQRRSWIAIFFKLGLPILPILISLPAWQFSQIYQTMTIKKFIDRQDDMNYLQQQISQLRLHLTHFAVYNTDLEQYKSMPGTIGSKIGQLTFLNQFVPTLQKSQNQFYLINNICELEKTGFYASIELSFPQRGNYTHCTMIGGGALTQGYTAAMTTYVQEAGAIFGANTQIASYTQSQKQAYLNSNFFTSTAQMTYYLNMHTSWVKSQLMKPIDGISRGYIFIWNSLCTVMIITVVLNIWLNGKWTLRRLRRDIKFVRCSYELLSCRNLLKEDKIRRQFLDNASRFEILA